MLYGKRNNIKVQAMPNTTAECPTCNTKLISKCGIIKIWHWAHKSTKECDIWSEGETLWHLKWKLLIKPQYTEVIVGPHRADIYNGMFYIELQHSPISPAEIQQREEFYQHLKWIFDVKRIKHHFYFFQKNHLTYFRWKWMWQTLRFAKKEIFLDFDDDNLFQIKETSFDTVINGYGNWFSKEQFKQTYLRQVLI